MKIHKLDAHDRLTFVNKENEADLFKGANDCLMKNPLSLRLQERSAYIYIFAHPRTNPYGDKELYWQPRLSRPHCVLNSFLFRAKSKTDLIEICWMLPPREQWGCYKRGNLFACENIEVSIDNYKNHRELLERPHVDDVADMRGHEIMMAVIDEMIAEGTIGKWYDEDLLKSMPFSSEPSR